MAESSTEVTRTGADPGGSDFQTSTGGRYALDRIFSILVFVSTLIGLVVLAVLLVDVARDGIPRLDWQFLTSFSSINPERTGDRKSVV